MSQLVQAFQTKEEEDLEKKTKRISEKTSFFTDQKTETLANQKNILVIEDNKDIIKWLSSIMKKEGYSVQCTDILNDGLRLMRKCDFHAVLLDVPVPKQKGLEFLSQLESEDAFRKQKIILFTGLDIDQSKIEDLEKKGLYSVIQKPAPVEKILKQLAFLSTTDGSKLGAHVNKGEKSRQKLEDICSEMLHWSSVRFCGVINNMGHLVAGGFKDGLSPYEDDENRRSMYMQQSHEITMRKEHDDALGPVEYIASKRKNTLMISIPIKDYFVLLSAEPNANAESIAQKISHLFKESQFTR